MMIFVLGTPDSGKSARAEALVTRPDPAGPLYYVATMEPYGEEGRRRVAKHRAMREGKGFRTIECPRSLQQICPQIAAEPGRVLLECVTNLVGNEIYAPEHAGWQDAQIVACVVQQVKALNSAARQLVAVSNEFAPDEGTYDAETLRYIRLVHQVNEELIKLAGEVHDVTGGSWRIYAVS